jgi:predicted anti-sigma-YlaC factor YlaD
VRVNECRHRGAALAVHFAEGGVSTLEAARAHLESCAACREYVADLSALQGTLEAWADEPPPATLRARVLARAAAAPRQAPKPSPAPDALPLFTLVPVMAALVAAIRVLAGGLSSWASGPGSETLALLDLIGPTPVAALFLLALGGLATLALAPALFLESRGPRRTLGAQS